MRRSKSRSCPKLEEYSTTNFASDSRLLKLTTAHSEEGGEEEKPMQEKSRILSMFSANGRMACVNGLKKKVNFSPIKKADFSATGTSSQPSFEPQIIPPFSTCGMLMIYLSPCFGSMKAQRLSFSKNTSHGDDKEGFSTFSIAVLHWIRGAAE